MERMSRVRDLTGTDRFGRLSPSGLTMDRREFIFGVATAGASLIVPRAVWAFDWQHYRLSKEEREELLTDAYRGARSRMKPLLVYLVPPDETAPSTRVRADALQKLIESSNSADLAPLAVCEVVCAGAPELKLLVLDADVG